MSEDLLKLAIALCKAGEKPKADLLLRHILRGDPHNETAWLWLADAQLDETARLRMLRSFLRANPQSPVARMAVEGMAAQGKAPRPKAQKAPAAKAAAPKPVPQAPRSGLNGMVLLYGLIGIVLVAMLALVLAWLLRGGQFSAAAAPTPSAAATESLPQATREPRPMPTPQPSPTSSTCGCAQSLAYLERSGARIEALQNDMLLAAEALERLPESKADFATLSGWGRARYEAQHADSPPQCLLPLHQKMVTYFASWWHAMDAIAQGEYNNAAAFLASFREKEAEIYAEAQTLLEQFQQCAPPEGGQDQTG